MLHTAAGTTRGGGVCSTNPAKGRGACSTALFGYGPEPHFSGGAGATNNKPQRYEECQDGGTLQE